MKKIDINKFKNWLTNKGAEILPVKSEHEAVRFQGKQIGILYNSGKCSGQYVKDALHAYKNTLPWDGKPLRTERLGSYGKQKTVLLERDGRNCFYCGKPLNDDISLEHLIPLNQQGTNKLSNMVLAHGECNKKMGSKNLNEKVEHAIKTRLSNRTNMPTSSIMIPLARKPLLAPKNINKPWWKKVLKL